MSTYTVSCPYCSYQIPAGSVSCPYCYRSLEACPRCKSFVLPGTITCSRCGEFVVKEPKVGAKIWIEGGGLADDQEVMKIQLENGGNIPTDISVNIKMPEPIEPPVFNDLVKALNPRQMIVRSYPFTSPEPGEFVIENLQIAFVKGNKEIDHLIVNPVKFVIYGRPMVQIYVNPEPMRVKLGDTAEVYVIVKNLGVAPALFVKVETAFPTSVQIPDPLMTLPEMKPDEERVALLKIRPLFSGEHVVKVRATYLSPAMGPVTSIGFESQVKVITVNAEVMRKEDVSPAPEMYGEELPVESPDDELETDEEEPKGKKSRK